VKGVILGGLLWLASLALAGCQAEAPPRGLEATCAKGCELQAAQCSPHQCRRGCNLAIDRLAEGQGDTVLACVARSQRGCDDPAWAHCATLVGVHADGGPPAPPPRPDVVDTESSD
jgi:hypothetical protein